jgi:hypothetical protein
MKLIRTNRYDEGTRALLGIQSPTIGWDSRLSEPERERLLDFSVITSIVGFALGVVGIFGLFKMTRYTDNSVDVLRDRVTNLNDRLNEVEDRIPEK